MAQYRLYFVSPRGHIQGRYDIDARDDAEAARLAEQLAAGAAAELWQASRKVKSFPADR